MQVRAFAAWLDRHHVHYAWIVAAVTFCTMLVLSAALGLPGALMLPLGREFGWTTAMISAALALRFALYGLLGPFTALLIDRLGARSVMLCGLGLVGSSMALALLMQQFWQLFVLWGVLLGLGSGLTALVLGASVANRWFVRQRGLVVGLLTASAATGQLLFLPLAASLVERYGWRWAVAPMLICSALVIGLVVVLMRDRPEAVGLQAFGAAPQGAPDSGGRAPIAPPAPAAPVLAWSAPFTVLRDACQVPVFWILFASFFICGLSTNGLIQTHFITLCSDRGLAPVAAASVLAMMGAFDLVGTILSGWLSDRVDNRRLLCVYYGLRGLALLWLPSAQFTITGLSLFAVFYGLDWIATVPPTVRLCAQHFGPQRGTLVFGWVFAGHQLGAAVAASGAGLSRSILASYTPALYAAALACLLGAGLVLVIRDLSAPPQAAPG